MILQFSHSTTVKPGTFDVMLNNKLLMLREYFDHRHLVYMICEIQNHLILSAATYPAPLKKM